MQSDQVLDQRQADAEAAAGAIGALPTLHEQIEDARQQIGIDALAVVADADRA